MDLLTFITKVLFPLTAKRVVHVTAVLITHAQIPITFNAIFHTILTNDLMFTCQENSFNVLLTQG